MYFKANLGAGFKTQPLVDRRFRPVPGGCHCLAQYKPDGTAGQPAVGFWNRPLVILKVIQNALENINKLIKMTHFHMHHFF